MKFEVGDIVKPTHNANGNPNLRRECTYKIISVANSDHDDENNYLCVKPLEHKYNLISEWPANYFYKNPLIPLEQMAKDVW
jgi:hypothetical protein